jgi:NAD(P)-dependent dehydrogenase (short-subunit alcohol dehydrogenase family)
MVGPDGTKKPLSRSSFEKRERESMSKEVYRQLTRTRLPALVRYEVLADAMVYLLRHQSGWVTGEILSVGLQGFCILIPE